MPWPWSDLSPVDLQPLHDAPAISQADLTPEQVALVTDVPSGGAFDIAVAAPDGQAAWRTGPAPDAPRRSPAPGRSRSNLPVSRARRLTRSDRGRAYRR